MNAAADDSTLRALIVDDEAPARSNLRRALQAHPRWSVVAEADSASSARARLQNMAVDALFLDIQMPGESGLSLARSLLADSATVAPLVIFVTAYDRFAIDAFEVHALDYLLKPVDDERLAQTLERAAMLRGLQSARPWRDAVTDAVSAMEDAREQRPAAPLTRLCVRSVGSVETVAVDAVRWIRSAGNYVELHLAERCVLHRVALSRLEEHLDADCFLRVHRTALVRRNLVRGLRSLGEGSYQLWLDGGDRVPVSERHLPEVRAQLELGTEVD